MNAPRQRHRFQVKWYWCFRAGARSARTRVAFIRRCTKLESSRTGSSALRSVRGTVPADRHQESILRRRILVENPSTYMQFRHSTIPEWEFIAAVAAHTGCGILCDVNNIYVSTKNHGWDPLIYLAALPPDAIAEIHLAGHSIRQLSDGGTLRIDDHGSRVIDQVWSLYEAALRRFGPVPTLIEWDQNIPPLDVLIEEAHHADAMIDAASNGVRRANAA